MVVRLGPKPSTWRLRFSGHDALGETLGSSALSPKRSERFKGLIFQFSRAETIVCKPSRDSQKSI